MTFLCINVCRSCRLYNSSSYRCCYNISKLLLNGAVKAIENGEVIYISAKLMLIYLDNIKRA